MSICPGQNPNSQILNSQVADELLTIRGIRASFVAGQNEYGKTVVSARSLGDVNVQVVMEKFGGGGHLNAAGATIDDADMDAVTRQTIKAITSRLERGKKRNVEEGRGNLSKANFPPQTCQCGPSTPLANTFGLFESLRSFEP